MIQFWLPFVIVGVLIDAAFIVCEYKKKAVAAVILKGLASLVFVLLGFLCYARTGNRAFGLLIVLGLLFGALGDVLLNLKNVLTAKAQIIFAAGIAVFLIGHVLYVAALIPLDVSALLIAVPVAAVLSAAILTTILKRVEAPKKLVIFGSIYLVAVIAMFSCALALLIKEPASAFRLTFTIGAFLFMVSDVILVFALFVKSSPKCLRAINLSCYYVGQLLIALSLLLV